jgi:hypothetical protein
MKTLRTFLTCLLFALAAGGLVPRAAHADDGVSFDYFYDALAPYGQWIDVPGYGSCWQPNNVDQNWQPYTDGYWVSTDAGWTWVSYEDFGYITYHYGRWADLDDVGWVWVPDSQWAPAWVSWREGGDYLGWAPLPPECHFDASVGVSFWADTTYDIGPGFYRFCHVRDFGAPVLASVMIDPGQNVTIINNTTNITNITTVNGIVYNGGPSYRALSHLTARPIQRLRLVQQTDPASFRGGKGAFATARGNQLFVPAPHINPPGPGGFKPQKLARTITAPKVNKGWNHVDPQQKEQIQAKFNVQTKGVKPEQAHAKPPEPKTLSEFKNLPTPKTTAPPTGPGAQSFQHAGGTPPAGGTNNNTHGQNKPFVTPGNQGGTPGVQPSGTPKNNHRGNQGLQPFNTPAGNPGGTPPPKEHRGSFNPQNAPGSANTPKVQPQNTPPQFEHTEHAEHTPPPQVQHTPPPHIEHTPPPVQHTPPPQVQHAPPSGNNGKGAPTATPPR